MIEHTQNHQATSSNISTPLISGLSSSAHFCQNVTSQRKFREVLLCRLTDKGLEEVGRASEFGEIGSESSATLEGIRRRYTPPTGSVTVEGQSPAASGSEGFIPLAELTQRSRVCLFDGPS